jgi:hypothetical protein
MTDEAPGKAAERNSEDHESRAWCGSATGRTCLADVMAEQVTWLWPGRIPAGKLVTLDGDPALGKSTLALTIGAGVTRAGEWPDGTRCDETGDVLIMSAEDGVADTIRPRLDAASADLARVHVIDHVLDNRHEPKPVTLAAIDEIERHITETKARLVIIDVLMAYMPGDAYRDQDVRKALTPLAKVAERTGCTMLLLRHLRKSRRGEPVYLGGGSIGIVGAARAGYVVIRDPDRDGVRVFASVKSNLANTPKSLAFRLVGAANGAVAVDWLGEDRRSASELLIGGRNNLGEMSHRVRDYVNARSTTRSGEVAQEFGITSKLANQYLNRLRDGGHVRMIARGVYGPVNTSPQGDEDAEDGEDTEDFAGGFVVGSLHREAGSDPGTGAGHENLHNPQHPQFSDASKSDTVDLEVSTCSECDALGATGKCVPCIVKRATVSSSTPQDGAHQLVESGGWAITEAQIGAAPSTSEDDPAPVAAMFG